MFFEYWAVLIVDDDQDVLSVSQLSMKRFEVYGLPLKIYAVASRAEAVALLNDDPEVANSLAIAFLDVVMETDNAGLQLCEYIRNEMGNNLTQIIIRTGQPGVAPEREVVDKYDINGYFSKIEATQDKLYSVVKTGVRQYLTSGMGQATIELLNRLIAAGKSREKILRAVKSVGGMGTGQALRWLFIDDQILFADEVDVEQGKSWYAEMYQREGVSLNPFGDRYVSGDDGLHLIVVNGTRDQASVAFLFKSKFAPSGTIINLMYSFVMALALAWHGSA